MLKICLIILGWAIFSSSAWTYWCSIHVLKTLCSCLASTNIKPYLPGQPFPNTQAEFEGRFECATDADCQIKPWEEFPWKVRPIRIFVDCMANISSITDPTEIILGEYKCRFRLAFHLPLALKEVYGKIIFPEK